MFKCSLTRFGAKDFQASLSKSGSKGHLDHCRIATDIARFINQSGRPTSTVLITGAGCSTASGIPDYRSKTGMYNRPGFKPLQFSDFKGSEFFQKKYWIRSMFGYRDLLEAECNAVHLGLAAMQNKGKVGPIVTQNVDGLHHVAFHHLQSVTDGVAPSFLPQSNQDTKNDDAGDKKKREEERVQGIHLKKLNSSGSVHELHGNLHTAICLQCKEEVDRSEYQVLLTAANSHLEKQYSPKNDAVRADGDYDVPESLIDSFRLIKCRCCDGFMRPGVVMFGDSVPKPLVDSVFDMVDRADRILCLGTSLQVFSAYRFVLRAAERGIPIGIINNGPTRADGLLEKVDPRMKTLGGATQVPPTVIKFEVDQLAAVIPLVAAMV